MVAVAAVIAVLALDVVAVSETAYAASVAGAPTALAGTGTNAQVALTWSAPASNGGAAITDYAVQYKLSSASTWTTFTDGVSATAAATVTGLTSASAYTFKVAAINTAGTGAYSATTAAIAHTTAPGAPTTLTATSGNAQLALTWAAPATTGGVSITDYQVQYKLTSAGTWTTFTESTSAATTATVTGLVNGSSYDTRVAAINSVGTGTTSTTATATPRTVPGAPTALAATAGNTQLALTWTPPTSTGGTPITDYQVTYKLTSASTWSTFADTVTTTTGATVTGLVNGSNYDIRVAAINAVGPGTNSSTVAATPQTVPGSASKLNSVGGRTQRSFGTATVTPYAPTVQPPAWSVTVAVSPAEVSTLAGSGTPGSADGVGANASFVGPGNLHVVGGFGYVPDGYSLRKVNLSTGAVTTVAGGPSYGCYDTTNPFDGTATGTSVTDDGSFLYWIQGCNNGARVRRMDLVTGEISTVRPASAYGLLITGPDGALYYAVGSTISRIDTESGALSTVATLTGVSGLTGESGTESASVVSLAADNTRVWAAVRGHCTDTGANCLGLVSIDPDSGTLVTVPGSMRATGSTGSLEATSLIVSAGDFLYATVNNTVLQVAKSTGAWAVIAGRSGSGAIYGMSGSGYRNGTGSKSWFNHLTGIDTDGASLFVTDSDNYRIRKLVAGTALSTVQPPAWSQTVTISPAEVSTLAGSGTAGSTDGVGVGASFEAPRNIHVVGGFGYVSDYLSLRKVNLSTGAVTTVAGGSTYGCYDSTNPFDGTVSGSSVTDDGTFLYWIQGCNSGARVRQMDLVTGEISTVVRGSASAVLSTGPGGALFYAAGNTVSRINTVNGTLSTVATVSAATTITALTADTSFLWAAVPSVCATGGTCTAMYRIDPATGSATVLSQTTNLSLRGDGPLTSAGDYLYGQVTGTTARWNPNTNTTVYDPLQGIGRWTKATGELILLRDASGQPLWADGAQLDVSGIDVSGSSLYVTSSTTYRIYRLKYTPPKPSDREAFGGDNQCVRCDGTRAEGRPIDLDTGAQFDTTTDVAIPGRGVPLEFTRTYDTRKADENSRLGYGWADSYDWKLTVDSTTGTATSGVVTVRQDNGSETTFSPPTSGGSAGAYVAPSRILADLVHNPNRTWTYTVRRGATYTFDASGRLTQMKDLNGYTTTLAYDGSGRLDTVTEPAGRTLTFTYDASNRIQTITDPASRVLTYTYNASGDLTRVTNLGGGHWDMTYDAHLLTVMTDPRGNHTDTTYAGGKATEQTDKRGKVMTFDYGTPNADGDHTTTVTRPGGAIDTYTYVGGKVTTQTKGAGTTEASTTSYTYDPAINATTSVTDNAHKTITYTHDSRGNQLSSLDPLGRSTSATYNEFNQPLTTTDTSSVTTTMTYDSAGRLLSASRPLVNSSPPQTISSIYTFDPAQPGDLASTTDANGETTHYTYDAYGYRTSVTDPTGRKSTSTYSLVGWLTSATTPEGNRDGGNPAAHTTTYSDFTGTGQPRDIKDAFGQHTYFVYDNNGNQTEATDAESRHTVTTYNAENQPTRSALNTVMTSTTAYDDNGNVSTTGDGLSHLSTYAYDALDRLTLMTDPLGHTTRSGYDAAGNRTTVTDAENQTSTTAYNAIGQATSSTDAEERTTDYGYDLLGRLNTVTDAQGRVTRTVFDSLGRRTTTQQGTSAQVTAGTLPTTGSWTYDRAGNVLTSTDGTSATTIYTLDDAGRTETVTDPLGRITALGYDPNGNTTTSTRPDTGVTTSTFDALGQLTGIDYPTGTPDVTYTYDHTGLRTSMSDGTGTTTYTHNTRGQLKTSTRGSTVVGYDYDGAGRQTTVTYPGTGRTLERTYDDADRLESVTDWADRTSTYTWNNDNTLNTTTLPNDVVTTHSYDDTNLTTKVLATNATSTVSDLRYAYDNTSLLTAVTDMTNPTTPTSHGYTFDSRARLETTTGTSNTGGHTFDNSNRLTGALGATHTLDIAAQLTASTTPAAGTTPATSADYTYDSHGNRTHTETTPTSGTTSTRTYGYDATDRLTTYTDTAVAALSLTYTYDGDGLRATKTRTTPGPSTSTQAFTWDTTGSLPLLLRDGDNDYLYGPGKHPFAQINTTTGEISYLHADHAGSTTATTDSTGTRTGTWEYDPYGNISAHTGTETTPFLYAGEYRDTDTGLTYLRARDYDPTTGAFLTRDPLEATTNTPYAYTNGNPLQYGDPTGMLSCSTIFGPTACGHGAYFAGAVQGAGDAAYEALDAANTLITEPDVFISNVVDACQAGLEAYESTAMGTAQCIDNLNPMAGMRKDFAMALSSDCPQESARHFGHGLGNIFLLLAPGAKGGSAPRLPQDSAVSPVPPRALGLNRPVGRASHNRALQSDIAALPKTATDIRVNQQQVNAQGQRVGTNRPDLQYTVNGQRHYVEYEGTGNPRGGDHRTRILANDPNGNFTLRLIP